MKYRKRVQLLLVLAALGLFFVNKIDSKAESTLSIDAFASGTTYNSANIEVGSQCYLYGSAACEDGGFFGNPCHWLARQTGALAATVETTYASFGKDGSYTDIMAKSRMVHSALVSTYEHSAGVPYHYSQAGTKLYYMPQ